MEHTENWIWLPKQAYPNDQTTFFSGLQEGVTKRYTVAEFEKKYVFSQKVQRAELRFSGDTAFQLFCNDRIVATGPVCVEGDFIGHDRACDHFYAFETTICPENNELCFFARVQMMPVHWCEFSKGHGGFMLSGILTLEDGTKVSISTDETWLSRKNGAYNAPKSFDGQISPDPFIPAECVENIWNTMTAPIPVRDEWELFAENCSQTLQPWEEKSFLLEFDKIWAGFVHVKAKTQGQMPVTLWCRELEETVKPEELIFAGEQEYRGFYMHSAGNIQVSVKNNSDQAAELTVSLLKTHYPVSQEAYTKTDDEDINQVLEICKHTLRICRQTHHLDSPRHCEPLACTGDYYIETLMTLFSFGDMRLAEFDVVRTAYMLERENGRMFHTTYSLIWVKMLYDVYMATGNLSLLRNCEKALRLLLQRFETYIGANGLIETPPDYMFVDWIYLDELSLHHPPKALGQSCLNMFYFGALDAAEKIFRELSREEDAAACGQKREVLRQHINTQLFDEEKGMYCMGLNTPTEENLLGYWMSQNTPKRYYLKHANILAACFGVCDDATGKELVHKIMSEEIEGDCQPYFQHYLLEAVFRLGLREQYTVQIISRWKEPVRQCTKGLVEGFVAPEPTYKFDHSHAWGGTPLYALPKALLGLEITKPGMREIRLSPSLLGFDHAKVEILTPFGKMTCQMQEGKKPLISAPKEINAILQ